MLKHRCLLNITIYDSYIDCRWSKAWLAIVGTFVNANGLYMNLYSTFLIKCSTVLFYTIIIWHCWKIYTHLQFKLCIFILYAWAQNETWIVKCKLVMITLYNFTEHHKANKLHIVSDFCYEIYQHSSFIIFQLSIN